MEGHPLIGRLLARIGGGVGEPIGRLIVDEVWLAVIEGTMPSGERLPTSRQVAIRLGISPRTVEQAYEELEARGVVATRPGEGSFISLNLPSDADRERHRRLSELCREALDRATDLGFGVDDLIAGLTEYRETAGPKS
jgi:GntR family transcriptional regulator